MADGHLHQAACGVGLLLSQCCTAARSTYLQHAGREQLRKEGQVGRVQRRQHLAALRPHRDQAQRLNLASDMHTQGGAEAEAGGGGARGC